MKRAIVILAPGFEEVEALTPVDYLRRAGIETLTVAIGAERTVTGARGIPVIADAALKECMQQEKAPAWNALILPGGMPGSANLAASAETSALIQKMAKAGKWICAICAAPALVLAPLGLLAGKRFTCYPGMEEKVIGAAHYENEGAAHYENEGAAHYETRGAAHYDNRGAEWSDERVVIDKNPSGGGIITSRGAGCAGEFAVAIISALLSEADGRKIAQAVLL